MNVIFIALLAFTPLALGASFLHASPLIVFMLSAVAIIPLAKFIGDATNALSTHTNPGVGGLLNATFGNSTELVVGILALHAGLITVVKASITGSILSNLLLVLGTAILAGGWTRERQKFNATAAKAAGSNPHAVVSFCGNTYDHCIFCTAFFHSKHAQALVSK
jgi:Ca2+:H+ antiporter